VEELRATQNRASKAIGAASGDEKQALIDEVSKVSGELKELEPQLEEAEAGLQRLLAETPNTPHDSAPDGMEEEDAVEVRRNHEEPPAFDFEPRAHEELGRILGVLDIDRGARTSGSRFVYLLGDLVFVQFALMRHAMDVLVEEGFMPVIPPVLVREDAMFGTGFLPTDEVNLYVTGEDELYLAGTSEVPLASLHAGEILAGAELPLRYAGFSPCFRREAGAAGKDTQGMFRVHQFDKVEMFAYVEPEESQAEHERLLAIEEEILQALELPYRVVNISVAELGASAAKKYDLEAWLPGQERFRELTSCSNTTDFQARRLDVRYRPAEGEGVRHVHTLNGTAVAVGRTIIGIVENHQRDDGSVEIPAVLHPFGAPLRLEPAGG
jgi:seryl-tRNA synthetase